MTMDRSYSELIRLDTYEDRFNYLRLRGRVGRETFGFERFLNQNFYRSHEWKNIRNHVIFRDNGCDMGFEGFEIGGNIIIHHMNPITPDQVRRSDLTMLDPEYLISVSLRTHNDIHYGTNKMYLPPIADRKPGDTKLW